MSVQTVLPRRGEITRSLTLPTFRVLAYQEATLHSKVAGYVKAMTVDKGSTVVRGQLLAEIEVPELLADEMQYKAETEVAHRNYERMAQAREKAPDLVVPQTVDDLLGQWEVARAKLERTRSLLQYARITAPFDGTITARFVDPGAFISSATGGAKGAGAALFTLMDFRSLRVQVFVPEAEVPFIRTGLPVEVTVDELPARRFSGAVSRFAYALDEATKTMLTEIDLPNPTGELRPGMYARVKLEVEKKSDAWLLPESAVGREKSGAFVLRVVDGKAVKTPVHVGFRDGASVEVGSEVAPDQPVIAAAPQTVSDGQAVVIAGEK